MRVDCPEEKKFAVVDEVNALRRQQGYEVVDVDGVRVTFPDGWGLVRASNTQPMLVLRFEAQTEARLQEIRGLFEGAVRVRPAEARRMNDGRLAVGVDLGGTNARAALIGESGHILAQVKRKLPGREPKAVADILAEAIAEAQGERGPLPVGVGVAGQNPRRQRRGVAGSEPRLARRSFRRDARWSAWAAPVYVLERPSCRRAWASSARVQRSVSNTSSWCSWARAWAAASFSGDGCTPARWASPASSVTPVRW